MPDPWGRFTAPGELAATFRHFAERRCGDYAPLYAHLGTRIAGDAGLLAIAMHASPGQSPPDLPLSLPVPAISWRAGIDLHPLNPRDPGDAAWLRALVWADHPERAVLLDGALRAAASWSPVPVHAGDATEQLPALIASAPVTAAVAIFHTAFLAHLPPWNGNASSTWSSCCPPPGLSTGSKPNPAATRTSPTCA